MHPDALGQLHVEAQVRVSEVEAAGDVHQAVRIVGGGAGGGHRHCGGLVDVLQALILLPERGAERELEARERNACFLGRLEHVETALVSRPEVLDLDLRHQVHRDDLAAR